MHFHIKICNVEKDLAVVRSPNDISTIDIVGIAVGVTG